MQILESTRLAPSKNLVVIFIVLYLYIVLWRIDLFMMLSHCIMGYHSVYSPLFLSFIHIGFIHFLLSLYVGIFYCFVANVNGFFFSITPFNCFLFIEACEFLFINLYPILLNSHIIGINFLLILGCFQGILCR